jgi:hypothetical protein
MGLRVQLDAINDSNLSLNELEQREIEARERRRIEHEAHVRMQTASMHECWRQFQDEQHANNTTLVDDLLELIVAQEAALSALKKPEPNGMVRVGVVYDGFATVIQAAAALERRILATPGTSNADEEVQ